MGTEWVLKKGVSCVTFKTASWRKKLRTEPIKWLLPVEYSHRYIWLETTLKLKTWQEKARLSLLVIVIVIFIVHFPSPMIMSVISIITQYHHYHLPLICPTSLSIISFSSWYSRTSVLLGTGTFVCLSDVILINISLLSCLGSFWEIFVQQTFSGKSPGAASLFQGTQESQKEDAQRLETCWSVGHNFRFDNISKQLLASASKLVNNVFKFHPSRPTILAFSYACFVSLFFFFWSIIGLRPCCWWYWPVD